MYRTAENIADYIITISIKSGNPVNNLKLQKLLYFKRILDDFGETETAQRVRSTCDRWRDYVPNTRLSKKRRHSPKN